MESRSERRRRARLAGVVGTGIRQQVVSKYHVPEQSFLIRRPGEHAWNFILLYRVNDPTSEYVNLDIENLTTIEGPGCYWCEQPYSKALAAAPCTGGPGAQS